MSYFLTKIFFEIFKANPIAIKCTTPPTMAAVIKLSRTTQLTKNTIIDGTVRITAIIVPLNAISLILSLDFVVSDNRVIFRNGNKNQRYFIFGKRNLNCLSSYKKTYSNQQSLNFVIPIIVILFLGIIYTMTQRADSGYVSFILIGGAAITMIYWIKIIKKMANDQKPVTYEQSKEQETKNWVYDLIKGEGEFVFVAEVPGPEDKISVRLIDGILYVRGTNGFSKEVPIEGVNEMQIQDFKYRNGVLTLRIK